MEYKYVGQVSLLDDNSDSHCVGHHLLSLRKVTDGKLVCLCLGEKTWDKVVGKIRRTHEINTISTLVVPDP